MLCPSTTAGTPDAWKMRMDSGPRENPLPGQQTTWWIRSKSWDFLHDATLRDSEETRSNILDETRRGHVPLDVHKCLFFTIYMKQSVKNSDASLGWPSQIFKQFQSHNFLKSGHNDLCGHAEHMRANRRKCHFLGRVKKIPQWWNCGGAQIFFWWQRSRERLDRLVLSFVFESYLLCSKVDSHCKILLKLN